MADASTPRTWRGVGAGMLEADQCPRTRTRPRRRGRRRNWRARSGEDGLEGRVGKEGGVSLTAAASA